jgi:hypothetical protein
LKNRSSNSPGLKRVKVSALKSFNFAKSCTGTSRRADVWSHNAYIQSTIQSLRILKMQSLTACRKLIRITNENLIHYWRLISKHLINHILWTFKL